MTINPNPSQTPFPFQTPAPMPSPIANLGAKLGAPSKLAWISFGLTVSSFLILPWIGAIAGIITAVMALKDHNNHNRILPIVSIVGGIINILTPILFAFGIGLCNLCFLSAMVGAGVK
jgi:hypothetical protein